jgi:hypothetical protein
MTEQQDQRAQFTAEIARLAKRNRNRGRVEELISTGHMVLLTGLWGDQVGAVKVTAPDGEVFGRADGWKVAATARAAEPVWDAIVSSAQIAERNKRLAHLLAVKLSSVPFEPGPDMPRTTTRYRLTPEQFAELCALAERMSAEHIDS